MLKDKEVLMRVIDRYTPFELSESLDLVDIIDEDLYEMEISDFVRMFKTKILNKQTELDIW